MRLLRTHMLALTRQLIVAHKAAFLGTALGRLRLEDGPDQQVTVFTINLLHRTDTADLLGVVALVELARQDTLGATQLRRARGLHIVRVSKVRIHKLAGGRVSREAPAKRFTDALLQSLEEIARLGGLQQTLHFGVGVAPAAMPGHVTQRDRQRCLSLIVVSDIPLKQPRAHMPGLTGILESRQVR